MADLVPSTVSMLSHVPVPGRGAAGRGGLAGRQPQHSPPVPWGHPSPLTPSLSAGRSLDRLDSVEILLPPKFPTWEEEYNQISESVNESSCINQVSRGSAEPRSTSMAQGERRPAEGREGHLFPTSK